MHSPCIRRSSLPVHTLLARLATLALASSVTASVDALREDVMHSSWFVEFQRDLRTSLFRTVQVSQC